MKMLQVVLVVAIFSGAQSVVSTEDVNQAKAKVLDWFNKVEFSVDSGVEQLSKDFTARLDATATEIRMKFEEQKQKFSDSEYSAKLTELQETLAAKQVEISEDVQRTLKKAGSEVHKQIEETKDHLNGLHGEGKKQFLNWFSEVEKKVNSGVEKLNEDFTAQLEATTNDLKSNFDQHKVKFDKSEYASKLAELSDTLKMKHEEISKDVAKTIAHVSEDVKAQLGQAKKHIQNIRSWMNEEL